MTGSQKFRALRAAMFLAAGYGFYALHAQLLGCILVMLPFLAEIGERP